MIVKRNLSASSEVYELSEIKDFSSELIAWFKEAYSWAYQTTIKEVYLQK